MRFTRLFSAITLVAAVTLLGSCGESSTPTSAGTDPSANLGPREFSISPSFINWERMLIRDPIPTDTRTVLIGGIIPLASYPSFGAPIYTGAANNWLDIDTSPNFSLNPLGWIVSFKLKPVAQTLPEGSYVATIPVTVPAAINNPQMITISFGCNQLVVDGPYREGNLEAGSQHWNRSSTFNNEGGYAYQDWCVFVPSGTTVWVWMQGGYPGCFAAGTLYDSYTYVFTQPDHAFVTSDDDGGCGYDSLESWTNTTGATKEYLVRATNFSTSQLGTYRIRILTSDPCSDGCGDSELRMGDAAKKKDSTRH